MTSWIEEWRRLLETDASSDALWLKNRGAPLRDRGVYNGVVETTEEALGSRINPQPSGSMGR
tara:strand:+ start:976 stop:1161 length:186 start_codon:yes stop_codon:yes gene_type:complete